MNPLTLEMLRNAIRILKTSKRFKGTNTEELEHIESFLISPREFLAATGGALPRDPREVLTQLGFKL